MWKQLLGGKLGRRVACLGCVLLILSCGSVSNSADSTSWQAVDLPGQPSGLRGVAYDPKRDCLWIITRAPDSNGLPFVTLARLDVSGAHKVTPTRVHLLGDGYIAGQVATDSRGNVWMAWGKTLAEYDPDTQSIESWPIPVTEALLVDSSNPGVDANALAMTMDSSGEVWIAAHTVTALFGFNIASKVFDRVVPISITPVRVTKLVARPDGTLMINGLKGQAISGPLVLAEVSVSTGSTQIVSDSVADYAVAPSGLIVVLDESNRLAEMDMSSGATNVLASQAPIANPSQLVVDSAGDVWFAMIATRLVGIGRVSGSTGALTTYPFPQPAVTASASAALPACDPLGGRNCSTAAPVFDPRIQAICLDGQGHIWVVTRMSGSGDPNSFVAMSPVYELT